MVFRRQLGEILKRAEDVGLPFRIGKMRVIGGVVHGCFDDAVQIRSAQRCFSFVRHRHALILFPNRTHPSVVRAIAFSRCRYSSRVQIQTQS